MKNPMLEPLVEQVTMRENRIIDALQHITVQLQQMQRNQMIANWLLIALGAIMVLIFWIKA